MTPDAYAILALILYGAIAATIVVVQFRRSGQSLGAWFLYDVARLYAPLMFHWRANRRCPYPDEGPALILANHRSPVDPMLLWMNNHLGMHRRRFRVIGFMTAREYCEIPGVAWICRMMESIPVDRQGKDIKPARAALDRLKQGRLLGVFPEGGINTGEGLREADTGIAWLALHAGVPIYPVFIHNSPQSESMVRPFCTLCRVRITYGDPIDLSDYAGRKRTHALLTEVTDLLMRRLAELGGVRYNKDTRLRPDREFPGHSVQPTRSTA